MALNSSPYGVRPAANQSGILRPQRIFQGIQSGLAQNIFKYQAVWLNPATGQIQPVTNPGGVPQKIFGVMAGVEYTPLGGRPAVSPYWPSGTVWDPMFDMFVYIWLAIDPNIRWEIQADGSVAAVQLGQSFNLTNPTNGITQGGVGLSQETVGAAGVAAGGQGQFTLIEFATDVAVGGGGTSIPGDAFTDGIYTIAYPQIGFAPQPSIG